MNTTIKSRWADITQRDRVVLMESAERCCGGLYLIEFERLHGDLPSGYIRETKQRLRSLLADAMHAFPETRIEGRDIDFGGWRVPFEDDRQPKSVDQIRREVNAITSELRSDL